MRVHGRKAHTRNEGKRWEPRRSRARRAPPGVAVAAAKAEREAPPTGARRGVTESEHVRWDPKGGDLSVRAVKPGETPVEAR